MTRQMDIPGAPLRLLGSPQDPDIALISPWVACTACVHPNSRAGILESTPQSFWRSAGLGCLEHSASRLVSTMGKTSAMRELNLSPELGTRSFG